MSKDNKNKRSIPGKGPEQGIHSGLILQQKLFPAKTRIARTFRKKPTPAEATLWERLRNRGFLGLKFRRQQVLFGFIADFYCESERIVIEADGGIHDEPKQKKYDLHREQVFSAHGLKVIRIKNNDILKNVDEALKGFSCLLKHKSPLLQERGKG